MTTIILLITDDHNHIVNYRWPQSYCYERKVWRYKKTTKESNSVKNKIKSTWRWVHNNQVSVKNKIQEQNIFWQVVMQFTQLTRHDTKNGTNIYLHTICLSNILIGQNMVILLSILQRWRHTVSHCHRPNFFRGFLVWRIISDATISCNVKTNIYNVTFNYSPNNILYLLTKSSWRIARIPSWWRHEGRIDYSTSYITNIWYKVLYQIGCIAWLLSCISIEYVLNVR